jgi:cytochrome c553
MFSRLNGVAWLAGATVLSLSVSLSARAQSATSTPDPVKGKELFYTCYGCHGIESYRNAYPDYSVPKLRHQHAAYIIAALHEYRDGERPHPTMHAQAESLSDQDIVDIAAYLQGEPTKPSDKVVGTVPKQAAACGACHGVNGLGVASPLDPKLLVPPTPHADYLEQALTAYHNGRRKNAVMDSMAQLLPTDEDIKVVAEFFASQPSPLETATTESK